MFKRIKSNEIYKDQWVKFYQDEIEFDDGKKGTYTWVNRKNGVGIVVLTQDKKILLNKEYRYVIDQYSWELPGGGIDDNEDPAQAAMRELEEETGLKVETVNPLGTFYPLHSFNTETVSLFYTRIPETPPSASKTESGEHMQEQKYVSFSDALRMIDSGEISDVMTGHAIQMVVRKLS